MTESHDLGKLVKKYTVEPLWKNYSSVMVILLPLTFLILFVKLGSSSSGLYTALLITIGVFFLGTLLLAITYILNQNKRLFLYEEGFIYSNQTSQAIRYEDITAVWEEITVNKINGIKATTNYRYTILSKNQVKPLVLDNNFADIKEAFEYIRANVIKYQLPIAEARYNRGESIEFGVLAINQEGLKIRDKKISWEEITGVKIANGSLIIKFNKNKDWVEPVNRIPNLVLFLMLINEIIDERIRYL